MCGLLTSTLCEGRGRKHGNETFQITYTKWGTAVTQRNRCDRGAWYRQLNYRFLQRLAFKWYAVFVFLLLTGCGNVESLGPHDASVSEHDPYQHENLQYIFDDNALPKVTISLTQEALEKKLELFDQNSRHETEVRANFKFDKNGVVDSLDSVGFRIKGNTSRARIAGNLGEAFDPENPQWHQTSLSIDFNEYIANQEFRGLKKITLRYFSNDPTFIRIAYAENLMRDFGVWTTPLASYAQLYVQIEGQEKPAYFGVYQLTEAVDSTYIKSRFEDRELGFMWKCTICSLIEPLDETTVGVEFIHQQDDQLSVRPQYDLKIREYEVEEAKGLLKDFIHNLNNLEGREFENWIEKSFDVDLFLRALAARTTMGDWDSHWVNSNNYYLYFHTVNQKVYFVPHDFDGALARSGLVEDPVMRNPFIFGGYHMGKPLVYKLLNNPKYRARYRYFLAELVDENKPYFHPNASHKRVDQLLSIIDPKGDGRYIRNDTNSSQVIYDANFSQNSKTLFNIIPEKGGKHAQKVDFYAARTMAIKDALRIDKSWKPIDATELKAMAEKQVVILGAFNNWNIYEARKNADKYEFKAGAKQDTKELMLELDAGVHEFYVAAEDSQEGKFRAHRFKQMITVKVAPNEAGNLVHSSADFVGMYPIAQDELLNSVTLVLPVKGHYRLIFDYTKPDNIQVTARLERTDVTLAKLREAEEAKTKIYLRGDFNEWGTSFAFEQAGADHLYKVTTYIHPGEHKFKIADALWQAVNIGSPPGVKVTLVPGDNASTVVSGANAADLFIKIDRSGFYDFYLDVKNMKKPVIRVKAK